MQFKQQFYYVVFFLYTFLNVLSLFSGINDLSNTGFEFISHSLLGSPLSRELGTTGQGLRGGALLITGGKVSISINDNGFFFLILLLTTQTSLIMLTGSSGSKLTK